MKKLRKGDQVIVVAGSNKSARGTLLRVVDSEKVIVEGVNLVKKHVKANPNAGVEGGIVQKEAPIHISNVAIYNPVTQKADRVGVRFLEDGKKVRFFKSNNELIDIN